MKDIADLIARVFISIFFIYEGIDSMLFFDNTIQTMQNYGVTFYPQIMLSIGIIALLLGGLMVLTGYYANIGAMILIFYWLPFTLIVYSFWNDPPEMQRMNSLHFMINFALLGGLLLLVANGSRKYSIKRIIHVMRLPS